MTYKTFLHSSCYFVQKENGGQYKNITKLYVMVKGEITWVMCKHNLLYIYHQKLQDLTMSCHFMNSYCKLSSH